MLCGAAPFGLMMVPACVHATSDMPGQTNDPSADNTGLITVFLCGDVMTGRGVDQVLPHPGDPRICEPGTASAMLYVEIAEAANGPVPKPVDFAYIWGDALAEFERARPDVRIINLETAVTTSEDCVPKGINYKMNPANIPCITAAGIDCCALANNHVLDWGQSGLLETLDTLEKANLKACGAGRDIAEARAPAIIEVAGKGRVIVFSFGSASSGIPRNWAAGGNRPGVGLLPDLSAPTADEIAQAVRAVRRPSDIVVAFIHWGRNWGYGIPYEQQSFAHRLIDDAGVDIVHGHSSHHAKGIEVHNDRLILYGCGDFIDDYEGIRGYEDYRDDLAIMYFASLDPASGRLVRLQMRPLQIRKFRLNRASQQDAEWLHRTLDRESAKLGARVELDEARSLILNWS